MSFAVGQSVYFRERIVTVRGIHHHEHGDAYICEDSEGVFFRARPESLKPVIDKEFHEKSLSTSFGLRQGKPKQKEDNAENPTNVSE